MVRIFRFLPDIKGLFLILSFLSLALLGGKKALRDADTLWHIRAGEEMLEKGSVLTSDIFSHTAYGKTWLAHEWLSEIIMAILHKISGLPGIVIFYAFLAALTFWLLFKIIALSSADEIIAVFSVSIASALGISHYLARPHIFTWLLGTLSFYLLLRGGRLQILLPLLIAIWVNLHGGFILGLVLQVIFIGGYVLDHWKDAPTPKISFLALKLKFPLVIFALSIFATGLNPFGYQLLLLVFNMTGEVFAKGIGEWHPPNFQTMWYFKIYILLLFTLALLHRGRIKWRNIFLMLFFVNFALTHARHVSLVGIFLTPLLAELLESYSAKISKRDSDQISLSNLSGPIVTSFLFFMLLIFVHLKTSASETFTKTFYSLPEKFSTEAITYLKNHPPKGKMLNEYSLGGYLLYSIPQSFPVFIDGRADMYGEKIFTDYESIVSMEDNAEELLKAYGIDWIIFPKKSQIIKQLRLSEGWKEIYTDEQVSILLADVSP